MLSCCDYVSSCCQLLKNLMDGYNVLNVSDVNVDVDNDINVNVGVGPNVDVDVETLSH